MLRQCEREDRACAAGGGRTLRTDEMRDDCRMEIRQSFCLMRIIGVIVGCLRGVTVIVQRSIVACAGVPGDQERDTVTVYIDHRNCHVRSASVHSD